MKSDKKFERLINLMILLLEASRPMTSAEIRQTVPGYGDQKIETFKRTFERDKSDLREMGIPVERQTVDPFDEEPGYRIPKEKYYLPDLELSNDEVAALWVAAGLLKIEDPGSAWAALMKLGGTPPTEADDSSQLKWFSVDIGLNMRGLAKGFEAVSERKTVTFPYRSSSKPPTGKKSKAKTKASKRTQKRTVDPYGIVHRKGSWYLVGRDHDRDDQRSFRFDRMEGDLKILEPTASGPQFEVPEGFEPQAALAAPPFVQGDEVVAEARVLLDAPTALAIERSDPWVGLESADEGAIARIDVTDQAGFINWVLWLGEGAEIIEPPELREAIKERLEVMCE